MDLLCSIINDLQDEGLEGEYNDLLMFLGTCRIQESPDPVEALLQHLARRHGLILEITDEQVGEILLELQNLDLPKLLSLYEEIEEAEAVDENVDDYLDDLGF